MNHHITPCRYAGIPRNSNASHRAFVFGQYSLMLIAGWEWSRAGAESAQYGPQHGWPSSDMRQASTTLPTRCPGKMCVKCWCSSTPQDEVLCIRLGSNLMTMHDPVSCKPYHPQRGRRPRPRGALEGKGGLSLSLRQMHQLASKGPSAGHDCLAEDLKVWSCAQCLCRPPHNPAIRCE